MPICSENGANAEGFKIWRIQKYCVKPELVAHYAWSHIPLALLSRYWLRHSSWLIIWLGSIPMHFSPSLSSDIRKQLTGFGNGSLCLFV